MAEVTIRPGVPADFESFRLLHAEFETWLNEIDGDATKVDPGRADAFAALMFGERPLCHLIVAEAAGEVIGYLIYNFGVWIGDEIGPCLYVADLFVTRQHQRQGVGRALMEKGRDIATANGARNLFWTVWRKNRAGRDFYRRIGAKPFEDEILMHWPV